MKVCKNYEHFRDYSFNFWDCNGVCDTSCTFKYSTYLGNKKTVLIKYKNMEDK